MKQSTKILSDNLDGTQWHSPEIRYKTFKHSFGFDIQNAKNKKCQHCGIDFKPIMLNEKYCWSKCPERKNRFNLYKS